MTPTATPTPETPPPYLSVNNIEVIYDHVILVLKGVSLQVPQGKIVALLGANGAGKSTTLKTISTLLRGERGDVTKGEVQFKGERVDQLTPNELVKRGLSQVMEGRHCFGHLTIEYYQRDWFDFENVKDNVTDAAALKDALEEAVKSHLMSDVPYGVLLSGGLDSSVISAITKKFAGRRIEDKDQSEAWWPQLHSFAVGLEGSPDLRAAQEVANHLGTVHHEIHFTVQEGLDAIRDVIYHIETYDVTTIRASTPMYLMSRKIKAMGIKMVLSGEGADEVLGGYLYFHKAPNAKEFHEETVRKLLALHMYDCARANKAMSAWGVEARVPFLDKKFLDVAMRINPKDKMCGNGKMEKQILRECFESYLPHSVAWRQKEQFSDGVGYSWIDTLKEVASQQITDQQLETAHFRFPYNTPTSKEGYLYRTIFEELFPVPSAAECVPGGPSVACSSAKAIEWDEAFKNMDDPSGRAVGVHQSAYK